ncbi:MAG: hypothetical protein GY696_02600 [Gammaproteobacteria bacterium]|nr:hypothetical protein [Gammaproteobacteria bacterium]
MRFYIFAGLIIALSFFTGTVYSTDQRQKLDLSKEKQQQLTKNMRSHLSVLNQLLVYINNNQFQLASELAEAKLGHNSNILDHSGTQQKNQTSEMAQAKIRMHQTASNFSQVVLKGDIMEDYQALQQISAACEACHLAYRVK